MGYFKVENQQLIPCPVNYRDSSGKMIFNFHRLPAPVLEGLGWKSAVVSDPVPVFDDTAYRLAEYYEDMGGYIARRWRTEPLQEDKTAQMAAALQLLGIDTEG